MIGAVFPGGLSDRFGREKVFVAEMIILTAFLAPLVVCDDFISLVIRVFGLGAGDHAGSRRARRHPYAGWSGAAIGPIGRRRPRSGTGRRTGRSTGSPRRRPAHGPVGSEPA